MKVALVTGCTGQTGSYLCELLLKKGYIVHGLVRRSSNFNTGRIDHIYQDPHEEPTFVLHFGDLADAGSMSRVIDEIDPDEVYNMGAQSHVRVSFDIPEYTMSVDATAVVGLLEILRRRGGKTKFYQASSSEMFGSSLPPQNEDTALMPQSPYGVAKVAAFHLTRLYRDAYNMFCCNGILFNHESERRGETFVTRKITRAAARISLGLQDKLFLGNLEAQRDWGFAGDYVEAIWLMLQADAPDDYVIATGETRSVRDFLSVVFESLGLDWERYVEIDPRYLRPAEIDILQGDPAKAKRLLNWEPRTSFAELATMMTDHDLRLAQQEQHLSQLQL